MKNLNQKGIGHHLLVVVLGVAVVLGASGYLVWDRQKNSDIEASASTYNYTDLSTIKSTGGSGSIGAPTVAWYACKISGSNSIFTIHTLAKYSVGKGPRVKVSAGAGKKTYVSKIMDNSSTTLRGYALKNVSEFTVRSEFTSGSNRGRLSNLSYKISDIRDCLGISKPTPPPANVRNYTDLSTIQPIGASGSVGSATVAWYACKNVVSDTSYTINIMAKNAVGERPSIKISAGYGKTVLVEEIMTNTATALPEFGLKNMDEFMVQSAFTSGPDMNTTRLIYRISDISTCN